MQSPHMPPKFLIIQKFQNFHAFNFISELFLFQVNKNYSDPKFSAPMTKMTSFFLMNLIKRKND